VTRYRLVKKDTLSASARAAALPVAFDDVDLDLLVELLLPQSQVRSRTQLRLQLEDDMAAALEKAMRGERAAFMDIYEYVPGDQQPGGVFAVTRVPGPLLREIGKSHCFVPMEDDDRVPQPVLLRDLTTGAVNELLTPGGVAVLRGFDIAWHTSAEDEGVFLVDALDGAAFRLEVVSPANDISDEQEGDAGHDAAAKDGRTTASHGNQCVTLRIPADVPAAAYLLEIRTRRHGGALICGRLPAEVRVAG